MTEKRRVPAKSEPAPVAKPPRKPKGPHAVQPGSGMANRLAAAILEVLAGVRSPTDAARALEVSLPRYYQLETRAVAGLVGACEPRSIGKQPSVEHRVAVLERELEQSRRESARQQALVRVAHRSLGLKAVVEPAPKEASDRKGRRKRRPVVRALKAAEALRKTVGSDEPMAVEQPLAKANGMDPTHPA
jgi:hypothetical protein